MLVDLVRMWRLRAECFVWPKCFFGWGAVRSMGSCGLDSFSEDILWLWVEWIIMIGMVVLTLQGESLLRSVA